MDKKTISQAARAKVARTTAARSSDRKGQPRFGPSANANSASPWKFLPEGLGNASRYSATRETMAAALVNLRLAAGCVSSRSAAARGATPR